MKLYRPTGLRELGLLVEFGFAAWPPRLPDQPIFYPVLTLDYARKIARDWNAVDAFSGHVGFVTEFDLEPTFAARYPIQDAGGRSHRELWVSAEELPEMNRHIQGKIRVIEAYPGPQFEGAVDPATLLPRDIRGTREL